MVIVDVPANPVYMGPVLPQDTNFTAIWQAKERRIIRCDKANPFFCLMQMKPQKIRITLYPHGTRNPDWKDQSHCRSDGNSTLIPPLCFSENRHLLSAD